MYRAPRLWRPTASNEKVRAKGGKETLGKVEEEIHKMQIFFFFFFGGAAIRI